MASVQHRVDVLSRQLTAGLAVASENVGTAGSVQLSSVPDAKALSQFIIHDNLELRETILEFLKVCST
jgi:hypothetical protein